MKLDFESIRVWLFGLPLIWKAAGLILLLLVFVFVLSSLFDSCGGWWTRRDAEKQKERIENLRKEANQLEQEVNQDAANYGNAKEGTNEARNDTNMSLNNYNAVLNRDYNGASYANANAARCRAYPNSNGC